jgi:hypothetical protein
MTIEILLPVFIVLLGVVALALYVLGVCLRESTRKLAEMNERLFVILGARQGVDTARALVASAKEPRRPTPGLAKKPPQRKEEKSKTGVRMTFGAS